MLDRQDVQLVDIPAGTAGRLLISIGLSLAVPFKMRLADQFGSFRRRPSARPWLIWSPYLPAMRARRTREMPPARSVSEVLPCCEPELLVPQRKVLRAFVEPDFLCL